MNSFYTNFKLKACLSQSNIYLPFWLTCLGLNAKNILHVYCINLGEVLNSECENLGWSIIRVIFTTSTTISFTCSKSHSNVYSNILLKLFSKSMLVVLRTSDVRNFNNMCNMQQFWFLKWFVFYQTMNDNFKYHNC